MFLDDANLKEFIEKVPKVELHAHLNGSLSEKVILDLIKNTDVDENNWNSSKVCLQKGDLRTLSECFEVFKIIHQLVKNVNDVEYITRKVVEEFAQDNVVYLELRTTPKQLGDASKQDYCIAVIDAIRSQMSTNSNITVKLLLSLDRGRGLDDAWETLHLAKYLFKKAEYNQIICGIDISGDPMKADLRDYIPLLKEARTCGLKTAVHLAEISNPEESLELLKSKLIDRIGHGSHLHTNTNGSQELQDLVCQQKIPIEICVTSNLKARTVTSPEDHHLNHWYKDNHPVIICTDDKGVFSTSLSNEYFIAAKMLKLSKDDIKTMVVKSADAAFINEEDKKMLKEKIKEALKSL